MYLFTLLRNPNNGNGNKSVGSLKYKKCEKYIENGYVAKYKI